jgi:DNA modification methylase
MQWDSRSRNEIRAASNESGVGMKPTIETDRYSLYLGDCLSILPTLAAGSVDAVVTDPPYGIGFKYSQHDDSPEGYGAWLWNIIEMCEALCGEGSPVFVWQAMSNCASWSRWFPRPWRIFAAAKNFVQIRPQTMQNAFDPVLVWWTNGKAYRHPGGLPTRDFHVADTASVISDRTRIEKGHPCPRPLDQMVYIVDRFTRPTATILDPFMGSGTTGVAGMKLGRKFIGIEIDESYFRIAAKRIAKAAEVPMLFEIAEKMEQGTLGLDESSI